jgi:hypothetical protein
MPESAGAPAPQFAKSEIADDEAAPPDAAEARPKSGRLVYTAHLTIAVFQVQASLDAVAKLAQEVGGYLMMRSDEQIQVRVPVAHFEATLESIAAIGDILHREIRAEDVSDHYRDLEARLQSARALRARLESLLERAQSVEDALKIERELTRVTREIERAEAMFRDLSERIAYSTVTVTFAPRRADEVDDHALRLPFAWLGDLGLGRLLDLR